MFSWGCVRRTVQPFVVKYWLAPRSKKLVTTRVEGLELEVFPGVFHPKYFGSSSMLSRFVSSLPLEQKSFLEIGCGCGVVSLCAARSGADVMAIDINPDAVLCTNANAARNKLRVDARVGDLFQPAANSRFDVIAWNPPYIPKEAASPAEIPFHGGRNFGVIRRFASEARGHLKPQGSVFTIISTDIGLDLIEDIFRTNGFSTDRVFSSRWMFGETMVILCAR